MTVWDLQTSNDFTSFCFPQVADKLFFEELVQNYFDEVKAVAEKWRPLYMLRIEPMKHPDFFEIENTSVIAISQKAADALQLSLKQIELLPIETDAGTYYALNVLCFVDCLNKEQSKYLAIQNGTIVSYTSLEFYKERLRDFSIFRLPELPYQIFVTSVIEDECEQSELKGLIFDPKSNLTWFNE